METTQRSLYDAAIKFKSINLTVMEGNKNAAQKLGVNETTVRRWRRQQ